MTNEDDNKLHRKNTTLENTVLAFKADGDSKMPLLGRKTKIICTIGPVTKPVDVLCKMLESGMNIARLNFSHGSHDYHRETIENIRKACEITKITCAILLDTKGPEIRTGMLKDHTPINLVKGQKLNIHCIPMGEFVGSQHDISVDHTEMCEVVSPGTIVKIDDGLILIRVEAVDGRVIRGVVLNNQELGEKKGVNIPGVETGLPALTEQDEKDILFGLRHRVDIIAPSFINCADDIRKIRSILGREGAYIKIISKIESVKGLENFDEILDISDGIMIARGDLGVEIPIQKVCMAQKTMIFKCNSLGKPIVTATQMLDSMIKNPNATRAEASDVANAVFDGTDCVMLSGETAKGSYPLAAVQSMARICRRSEASINYEFASRRINSISKMAESATSSEYQTESVTAAAVKIANELSATLIFALTDSGNTAGHVSKYMSPVPIICVTPDPLTARQALLRKNLWPLVVDKKLDDEQRYHKAKETALAEGWCAVGDCVVVVSGKQGVSGSSYKLRVLQVD